MGPQVAMAIGQPGSPLGVVDLEVKHPRGHAVGKAQVMEMRGNELLLGNDFLGQFRRLTVDFTLDGHLLTVRPPKRLSCACLYDCPGSH